MTLGTFAGASLTSLVMMAIASIIIYLSRNWILEHLIKGIQHGYDKKLSKYNLELKNTIDEKIALYNSSNSSYLAAQQESIKIKIENIEKLWSALIKLKNNLPYTVNIIDALIEEELLDPEINIYDHYEVDPDWASKANTKDIENVRPFVGDKLWYLFYVYQTVHLRIVMLTSNVLNKKNLKEKIWFNDSAIIGLLKTVLSESEMAHIDELKFQKMSYFGRVMEKKILLEMHNIIDGKHFSDNSLQNAQDVQKAISVMELNKIKEQKNDK